MKNYYDQALKAGQKQYKESVARSEYPYLPVLDEMLPVDKQTGGVDLGVVQIPTEWIVGTKNIGRTASFASNFMPVVEENSEFASKWKNLCRSHLEEGIREPIKAYEYRNRYYVEEGNKRVSVMKFFGAVTIPGQVIRILPVRDGSDEIELYYEYVDFYQITRINFLEFSKRGSYKQFLRLTGREDRNAWDDEVIRRLRTDYHYFRKAFQELGGEKLEVTPADALLLYSEIYGWDSLRGKNEAEMREALSKVWKEIILEQEEKPIDVIEDPGQEEAPGLLSRIIPTIVPKTRNGLKALFLYRRKPEHSNWVSGHEKGRVEVERRFRGRIETTSAICQNDQESEAAMRQAIDAGTDVIFATAAEMINVCLKVALDHPETVILICALNVSHKSIQSYYPRMYEAKFISGAIAGAMCSNDRIGYLTDYPVYGNIAEVNAFARGVQLSNANAKVYLEWVGHDTLNGKAMELINQGISLISVRNRNQNGDDVRDLFGLVQIEDGNIRELVTPVWNWANYYERILQNILDGSLQAQDSRTSRSLNYYWGMSSDMVGIQFSDLLPRGTRYLGELIQKAIRMGVCRPFYDPKLDENGRMQWHNIKATISMEEIIAMDWLEPNIEGSIPTYDQLPESARKLVDVMGVGPARKEQGRGTQ